MNELNYNYLKNCASLYHQGLTQDIFPFWLKYGLDTVNGGVYTCLDRDGALMDTTKSVWFQGRFAFSLAFAYNNIEKNSEWLAASKSCIDFIEKYCFDSDGHMFFEITCDGIPLRRRRYIYSECFAIIAMAEYAKASGDESYGVKAFELLKRSLKMLDDSEMLPSKYLDSVPMRGHSITMILINTALCVRSVYQDELLDELIERNFLDLKSYFFKPEFKALLETVGPNGEFIDTCMGRTINPGHAIETAWFLFDAAATMRNSAEVETFALQLLDWSWEWGWDTQHGGIINFRDCKNFPPQDYSQDMKFWWPQCEAIVATLYAYKISGEQRYLDMHKMAHDWCYSHFPDPEFGEWYGYLHRDGSPAQPAKGNLFKGPFHIPRMMIKSKMLIDSILDTEI